MWVTQHRCRLHQPARGLFTVAVGSRKSWASHLFLWFAYNQSVLNVFTQMDICTKGLHKNLFIQRERPAECVLDTRLLSSRRPKCVVWNTAMLTNHAPAQRSPAEQMDHSSLHGYRLSSFACIHASQLSRLSSDSRNSPKYSHKI